MIFVPNLNMHRYYSLIFCCFFLFLSGIHSRAQSWSAVDEKINSYPSTRFDSVEALANMIRNDFSTDMERVRAIYSWITNNVAYSYEARGSMSITYYSEQERLQKIKAHQERLASITLRSKKAVCHGYSMLFKQLCDELGIHSEIVRGFGKSFVSDIASEFESNHAWNKVTIDDRDYLVDTTWGAGYMRGNRFHREVTDVYFLTPPEIFIRNHYPESTHHSLLNDILSRDEFLNRPLVYETALANYELISPVSGTLGRKDIHSFEIASKHPITKLRVYYNGEWLAVEDITVVENNYRFQITLPNKIDRELLIYIGTEAAFGFKVIP